MGKENITIQVSAEWKECIDDVADQLDTSRKAVLNMILEWFFSQKGSGEE